MVASRFENSLFSRPWMAQTGVYPGQPAATPQQAATPASAQPNAPLQIMAGSLPAAPVFMPQGQGEGIGGGGMDPNTTGYGTSPSFGSFATNVLSNLGPLGMFGTLATMVTDPQRTTPYGILGDVFGWGQPQRSDPFAEMNVTGTPFGDLSDMYGGMNVTGTPAVTNPGYAGMNVTGTPYGDLPGYGVNAEGAGYGGSTDSSGNYGGPAGGADTANSANSAGGPSAHGAGTDPNGNEWRTGGYTGAGLDGVVQPGMPAGTVHEGEQVLNARSTRKYGTENLAPLNEGKVPRNKLVALAKRYR